MADPQRPSWTAGVVRWVLPAVLGALSSLAVALVMNDDDDTERRRPVVVQGTTNGLVHSPPDGETGALLALQRERVARSAAARGEAAQQAEHEALMDRQTHARVFHAQLAEHDATEEDPEWAASALRRVGPGLDVAAGR